MKEKDILRSIKKVVQHSTPKHIPFLENENVTKRKGKVWLVLPFATLTATAIVVALTTNSMDALNPTLLNPNRNFLQAFANTMVNPGAATIITASTDSEIFSRITIPNYETENTFKVNADGTLSLNNNDSTAQLLLTINQFELTSLSQNQDGILSDTSLLVKNQSGEIYFDGESAFVDLPEEATIIPQLLFPSANRSFPTQFKTPFAYSSLSSLIMPDLNEENINALIDNFLPMVEGLDLLESSFSGSTLSIRYEITQSDLSTIYETMILGTRTRDELNEEEINRLDQEIERNLEGITLNQFELAFSLNLLTNQIESILVDVDVENFYRYDQDIPNGDDDVPYFVEWTYNYDLFFTAQIETSDSPIMLIGPVNKEEYELIELTFENPHLF